MTSPKCSSLRVRTASAMLALVAGIGLLFPGSESAEAATCSTTIAPNFPTPIVPPTPAVKQAIGDLIAQYGVALDTKDGTILKNTLDPSVTFEVCSAGGNTQDFLAINASEVLTYYNDLWPALATQGLTPQHLFSGVVLSSTGMNTVEGRFTQLVFLQTSFLALNPDYSGTVKATFVKNGSDWQFESFLLIALIPNLGGGITVKAR